MNRKHFIRTLGAAACALGTASVFADMPKVVGKGSHGVKAPGQPIQQTPPTSSQSMGFHGKPHPTSQAPHTPPMSQKGMGFHGKPPHTPPQPPHAHPQPPPPPPPPPPKFITVPCPVCHGSGRVKRNWFGFTQACPECHGSGKKHVPAPHPPHM